MTQNYTGKKHKKRWLAVPMLLLLLGGLAVGLTGIAGAEESPVEHTIRVLMRERQEEAVEADEVQEVAESSVPWAVRQPSVSEMDPFLPDIHNVREIASATEPVEDSYFSDAVFLGDSRTEGFMLYSGLKEGTYLFSVGATVDTVLDKKVNTADGKMALVDAMKPLKPAKVYIMLGVNELGWVRPDRFQSCYGAVIDRIRADHPETKVVIQSILPVTAEQEAKGSYVNNGRIAMYNELLKELAKEKNCAYMNISEAVTDTDGCLFPEMSADGVHLNPEGCRTWLHYLRTHAV